MRPRRDMSLARRKMCVRHHRFGRCEPLFPASIAVRRVVGSSRARSGAANKVRDKRIPSAKFEAPGMPAGLLNWLRACALLPPHYTPPDECDTSDPLGCWLYFGPFEIDPEKAYSAWYEVSYLAESRTIPASTAIRLVEYVWRNHKQ